MQNRKHKMVFPAVFAAMILLCASSCGQTQHTVTAQIEGLGNGNVVVSWALPEASGSEPTRKTVKARNGKFEIDLFFPSWAEVSIIPQEMIESVYGSELWPAGSVISLFLSKDEKVDITGKMHARHVEYEVTGSDISRDRALVRSRTLADQMIVDSVSLEMEKMYYTQPTPEAILRMRQMEAVRNNRMNDIRRIRTQYIDQNRGSDLSALFILELPIDSVGKYYGLLDEPVKQGPFRGYLDMAVMQYERLLLIREGQVITAVGNPALPFTLTDNNGNPKSLSDVRSEYVVLDFWGSWCPPCIEGIPTMKEYYAKYKNRMEVIGVACQDRLASWLAAINEYSLPWTHVIDDENESIAVKYGVEAFPTKIILDRNRKVVARFQGETEEFYMEMDKLFK